MDLWLRLDCSAVLVVAPHPDDEVIGCGGLITKCHDLGGKVAIAYLTCSSAERRREATEARHRLGAPDAYEMGWEEGHVRVDEASSAQLARLLEAINPARVFVPSADDVHRDHRASIQVLARALATASRTPGEIFEYEGFRPHAEANAYLDISDVSSRKFKALACYATQERLYRLDELVRHLNAYRARTTMRRHVAFAEAFLAMSVDCFLARARSRGAPNPA
ncbi:PIG-L deacetylase family protein [Sorangium cellulosum]|nr:PIG-L deacetylase family protein [Sorangium cellulosum]